MRRLFTLRRAAIVAAAVLVSGSGVAAATTAGVSTTTGADVSALSIREAAVISVLKAYPASGKGLAAWEARLKAAEVAQASAEATLNHDLVPIKAPSGNKPATQIVQDENGNNVAVTLDKIIDPAPPATSFDGASGGMYLIATEFTINDVSKADENDGANSDAAVVGSNNQDYSAVFNNIAGCTNFNGGDWSLAPHQAVTGCVVFQLPNGVNPSIVQFNPSGGFGGTTAQWKV